MTTKPRKSLKEARADKAYIEAAAKLTPFEIDPVSKLIFVPYALEDQAREDLTVQHLIKHKDCNIELTIEEACRPKPEFAPVFRDRIIHAPQQNVYQYNPGDEFRIVNSAFEVEITEVLTGVKGGLNFWFKYTNRPGYPDFKMYATDIKRNLDFSLWLKI